MKQSGWEFYASAVSISGMPSRFSTAARSSTSHPGAMMRIVSFRPLRSTVSFTRVYGCGESKGSELSRSGGREMAKKGRIVSYTAEELAEKRRARRDPLGLGESRNDDQR